MILGGMTCRLCVTYCIVVERAYNHSNRWVDYGSVAYIVVEKWGIIWARVTFWECRILVVKKRA